MNPPGRTTTQVFAKCALMAFSKLLLFASLDEPQALSSTATASVEKVVFS